MVVQTVWLLPDGNVDSRRGLPVGGILRGRHEVNGELEQFSHPEMPNGTWGVIALHLGVVQGRVNPVLRLCMQYEIIVIFLYVVLAVFYGRGLESPCIASFYRVLFAALEFLFLLKILCRLLCRQVVKMRQMLLESPLLLSLV
jgi:hypothetical protein